MRHPKGKDLFRRLVATADVVVDNFTASTLEDWGFGWEVLKSIKPDIIYLQAPGFGRAGPYADYRSYGPTAGAISCYAEAQWRALAAAMGNPAWAAEPRFATLDARLANQDALDEKISAWTLGQERYALMESLQRAGVPAAACQDTSDRYDRDPQ